MTFAVILLSRLDCFCTPDFIFSFLKVFIGLNLYIAIIVYSKWISFIFQSNFTIWHLIFNLVICFQFITQFCYFYCCETALEMIHLQSFFVLIDWATIFALLCTKFYLIFSSDFKGDKNLSQNLFS